jgi:hypothetical protein
MAGDAEDLRRQAQRLRSLAAAGRRAPPLSPLRLRIYQGLLLFIVVAAAPLAALPPLRARLLRRASDLRQSLARPDTRMPPARAVVGENLYAFPKELERPVVAARGVPGVYAMPKVVFRGQPAPGEAPAPRSEEAPAPEADEAASERPPEFRQGDQERQAYDLLLKQNEAAAALVRGVEPGLRFKRWAAARSPDQAFLVDLTFTATGETGPDVHYIWKVKLDSKEIEPLSHNARALQKSPS